MLSLDKCTHLCNHYSNQIIEHFCHPPQATNSLFSITIDFCLF